MATHYDRIPGRIATYIASPNINTWGPFDNMY